MVEEKKYKKVYICDKGVDNLRLGIIVNAVDDYLKEVEKWEIYDTKLKSGNYFNKKEQKQLIGMTDEEINKLKMKKERTLRFKKKKAKKEMKSIIKFFESNWYRTLMNIDSKVMMSNLKRKLNKKFPCLWNIYLTTYTKKRV